MQELLDCSLFTGTNIADLVHGQTNLSVAQEPIRLATPRRADYFIVDPARSAIRVSSFRAGLDLRRETPPYDAVPGFEAISGRLLRYAQAFGVSTNEIERKEDGSILLRRSDAKTRMRGGAIQFIEKRSVSISRAAAGYPFLLSDDKVELALGVHGWLDTFELHWRSLESVRTNRVCTIEQMMDNIRKGRVLGDVMNSYPADGLSQIILKDFRVFYYIQRPDFRPASTNADIFPIISFHAVFKSKSGHSEDGGLYTRLLQP